VVGKPFKQKKKKMAESKSCISCFSYFMIFMTVVEIILNFITGVKPVLGIILDILLLGLIVFYLSVVKKDDYKKAKILSILSTLYLVLRIVFYNFLVYSLFKRTSLNNTIFLLNIVFIIIFFIIQVCYYAKTLKLTKKIKKNAQNESNMRNLEGNETA